MGDRDEFNIASDRDVKLRSLASSLGCCVYYSGLSIDVGNGRVWTDHPNHPSPSVRKCKAPILVNRHWLFRD